MSAGPAGTAPTSAPVDGTAVPRWTLYALAGSLVLPILLVAAVAAVAVGRDAGTRAATEHAPVGHPSAVAPLDLEEVPGDIADHYHAAETHRVAYEQIPCYCGCEQFLGHRHLYDCFVRPDGAGWDAHAAGCGICIAEAALARPLLDAGADLDDVRAAVVEQFESVPPTTVPPT